MLKKSAVLRLVPLALVCTVALVLSVAAQQSAPAKPRAAAPTDPAVIDLAGFRRVLEQHREKPLLVNFWATWCEPCRDEYPTLVELARKYAPQGLDVVGVSLDDDAEINLVRHFLAKYQPPFPNFRKRPGSEEVFINGVNPKWSGAIPATFFYARDGRQIGYLVGEHSREDFERAIRLAIESAPKSPPAPGFKGSAEGSLPSSSTPH